MITQRASGPGSAQELLESAIGRARDAGREDLVERLTRTRRSLRDRTVPVLLTGGTQPGRRAVGHAVRSTVAEVVFTAELTSDTVAVVFLADAGQALAEPELDQLRTVSDGRTTVLLTLNDVDRFPAWPQVLEADLARLGAARIAVQPFAVATRVHALACASQDPKLGAASGIPALADRVRELAGRAHADRARSVARQVLGVLTELEAAAGPEPRALPKKKAPPRPADAPPAAASARSDWSRVLRDGFGALSSDVDFDLRSRARTVLVVAEQIIDRRDPNKDWAAFDTWLRERLGYELQQTHALLSGRVGALASEVADRVGAPVPHRLTPPLTPAELFEHLPHRELTDDGRPLAARSRTLISSAYGGVMMTFVLPRLAGLAIPTWILGSAALVAAVALTAATLTGERKRQLDRRRGQAKSILRHHIDGFLLRAGKYTKDSLRAVQQQLRDEATARSDNRHARRGEPSGNKPARRAPEQPGAAIDHAALRRRALTLLGSTGAAGPGATGAGAARPTSISA